MRPGSRFCLLIFSKTPFIRISENVITKKANALNIPIFIISESGAGFLSFILSVINSDKKETEIITRISFNRTRIYESNEKKNSL
jgi:hypothetical protein